MKLVKKIITCWWLWALALIVQSFMYYQTTTHLHHFYGKEIERLTAIIWGG